LDVVRAGAADVEWKQHPALVYVCNHGSEDSLAEVRARSRCRHGSAPAVCEADDTFTCSDGCTRSAGR
jgi:hypothetical protein